MSSIAVEVTGFSPTEYLTGRVSASRQEVLTSSHTYPLQRDPKATRGWPE
jgi:hypothetical protein